MKRRELASVADSVVGSFVSRNNDVDGWWAIGLLAGVLSESHRTVQLDLVTGTAGPDLSKEPSGLRFLPATWQLVFARVVQDQGVRHAPRAAMLRIRFVPMNEPDDMSLRYSCDVVIEDYRGRRFAAGREGTCRPHDLNVERRSAAPNRLAKEYGIHASSSNA